MSSHDASPLPLNEKADEIHPCSGSQATELRGSSASIQGHLRHHPLDGDGGDQLSTSTVKSSSALSLNAIVPGGDKNTISCSNPELMSKRAIEVNGDNGGRMVKRQRLGSRGSSQHLTQQKVCGPATSPVEGIKEEILFLASLNDIPKKSQEGGIEGTSAETKSCDDDPNLSKTVPRRVAEACLVASGTNAEHPGVAITPAPDGAGPLSDDDIKKFEEDGFIMLKQAFSPTVAAEARDYLWRRIGGEGITRDPSTWVRRKGIAEIYGMRSSPKKRRGKPWTDALSPRLKSAVSQLVGAGAWEEFGCGWWVISFPGFASLPWGAEGTWHVDGAHFKHYPHSREIGLVPVFLFSDIRAGGGGTALLRGSHRRVAEILWRRAGKTGMKGPKLSDMARKVLLPPRSQDVVETVGEAGDVMLTHPLLLHARSTNLAPVEEAGVRFMCHPAIPLKQHMDFKAPPATFSPVQRVVWNAREPLDDMDGRPLPPIYSADECDHQPMNKPMSKPMSKQGQRQRAR